MNGKRPSRLLDVTQQHLDAIATALDKPTTRGYRKTLLVAFGAGAQVGLIATLAYVEKTS
jgi:hypothetical protein